MAYTAPHLGMLDTTAQTIASAGTPQLITFDTTVLAVKIAVTSSSRFTFNEAGNYIIILSPLVSSGTANKTIDIWLRVNGSDVTNSNTKLLITTANDRKRPSINLPLTVTAGQYVEFWMNGDSTSINLTSVAAGAGPTRPFTPCLFLTIDKLS